MLSKSTRERGWLLSPFKDAVKRVLHGTLWCHFRSHAFDKVTRRVYDSGTCHRKSIKEDSERCSICCLLHWWAILFREDVFRIFLAIFSIVFFNSSVIDRLEIDGLTPSERSFPVLGLNNGPSLPESTAASRLLLGSYTASYPTSVWGKVVKNDRFARFRMMRTGLFAIAACSGLDTCSLCLRLAWLLDVFFQIFQFFSLNQ